jgi:tetrathionate reductase subunit C
MDTSIIEVVNVSRDVAWLPWAVQYFFLIGLSTGALFLSLPGLLLRWPSWVGMSRRALLAALVCGATAPVALVADLHQPGRFLNFYLHPNASSWMAWGAFFIPLFLVGMFLYAWLALRPELLRLGQAGGRGARWYRWLAYGGYDSRRALAVAALLAVSGAILVLIYTGMEVMVVRARPLWHTPFLPLQFAVTALAGAMGLVLVLERIMGVATPSSNVRLSRLLAMTQAAALAVGIAWFGLSVSGLSAAHTEALAQVMPSHGWRLTAVWAAGATVLTLWLAMKRPQWSLLTGLIALHSAWMMRWTVFIGGQEIPKTGAGYYNYQLPLGHDGLLGIIGTAGLWLFLFIVLTSLLPWGGRTDRTGT